MDQDQKTQAIKHVLTMLINDANLYSGGIPSDEDYLADKYGLTYKQLASIEYRLYAITKTLRKLIK